MITGNDSDDFMLGGSMAAAKIYCEHGALTAGLRALQREGRLSLIYFPYDPNARTPHISPTALPSEAQYRDLNLAYNELTCRYDDFQGSEYLERIREIVGPQHRRDALHIDSAYKSGCVALVTRDTDILNHRDELHDLLRLRIINPDTDHAALVTLLEEAA
jgi:hypothetical protein